MRAGLGAVLGSCPHAPPSTPRQSHTRSHLNLSVQFSCSVVSDSSQPHESQHARPPCPSPTPRVHSDSRPSSQGCHPAISGSQEGCQGLLDGGHPVSVLRSSGLTKAGGCRLQHRSFTSTAGNIFSLTTVFHDATQASVTSATVGIFTPEKSAEGPSGPLSRLSSVPRGRSHHQRSLHI